MDNKHLIPVITENQLGEIRKLCAGAVAETPEGDEEVIMHLIAQITLAAVNAEHIGYLLTDKDDRAAGRRGQISFLSPDSFSIPCAAHYQIEGIELYTAPPVTVAKGRIMPRHEFAQMVNELRDVPAVQSKRERIVRILRAFNIKPVQPS